MSMMGGSNEMKMVLTNIDQKTRLFFNTGEYPSAQEVIRERRNSSISIGGYQSGQASPLCNMYSRASRGGAPTINDTR